MFAILGDLAGANVLDAYAGSGALGIEALSRGAESVVFVERSAPNLDTLRENLDTLDLASRSRVVRGDAVRTLRRLASEGLRFDLVLIDPPYADPCSPLLEGLVETRLLEPGSTLVVERGRGHAVEPVDGLVPVDERAYGDTTLTWLEARREEAASAGGATERDG